MTTPNTIKIDETVYVRADSVTPRPAGNRAVVVVDRGWIFAGDVTRENGRIKLDRAVWVFRWETVGFDVVLADPSNPKVMLRKMKHSVDLPDDSEIFFVPVDENWGL